MRKYISMIRDYRQACAVLGVKPGAERDEIKSAYRELVRRLHPDAHPGQNETTRDAMALVTEAYAFIEDSEFTDPQAVRARAAARIIGGGATGGRTAAERDRERKRFEEACRQERQKRKEQLSAELEQKKGELAQRRKEKEILNEIRMIRLAAAISAALSSEGKSGS